MCVLAVLSAYGLYDHYHARPGFLAELYTVIAFVIGIFVPVLWIFLPGYAGYLTIVAMGLWAMYVGFSNLAVQSFLILLAVVTGYTLLLFLDQRFPKFFPEKISEHSILIPAASWAGWWFVTRENSVAYIMGGGVMLYLTAGIMLARWRPELGKRIGIKITSQVGWAKAVKPCPRGANGGQRRALPTLRTDENPRRMR